MNFALNTLNKRKPLWLALSDLFLDTELQDSDLQYVAKAMKASDYSLEEIETILMEEVFPTCISNLKYSPAGEWSSMDETRLYRDILKARRPNRLRQWMHKRNFWMIEKDWETVLKFYEQ